MRVLFWAVVIVAVPFVLYLLGLVVANVRAKVPLGRILYWVVMGILLAVVLGLVSIMLFPYLVGGF